MKKMVFFTLLLLLLLSARIFGQENQARKIFEEGWVNYRSAKTIHEKEDIYMAIIKVSDPHKDWYTVEEVKGLFKKNQWKRNDRVIMRKEMTRYLQYDAWLEDKMNIYFNHPPREEGTQFVVLRHPQGPDEMWMYNPALKRNRRLTPAAQEDHFMGSTLTYEDIRRLMGEVDKVADQFIFSLTKDEIIDGRLCYVIEVRPDPVKKPDTGYGLRKFYREKKSPVFVRVEYFDKNGRLLKTQNNSAISYVQGLWRPTLVEMYDAGAETSTVLYWTEKKILEKKELPLGIFTPIYMERHGR